MFLKAKSCFPDPLLLPVLPSFHTFHQISIVKIHIQASVFFSGRVPQVLVIFLSSPKLDLLKPKILGHSARKKYRIIFSTFYYTNLKKVVKKGANQAKVGGS